MKKTIKYLLLIVILLVIILSLAINISANNITEYDDEDTTVDSEFASILNSQLTDYEISALNSCGIPELAIDEEYRSKHPIIARLGTVFSFHQVGEGFDCLLDAAQESNNKMAYKDYIALSDKPYFVSIYDKDGKPIAEAVYDYYDSGVPTYISDIMGFSNGLPIEEECRLEGIYCFDGETSHQGIAVYLLTDKGIYVEYYKNSTSKGVLFSEEDFRAKAAEYYAYLVSYENNYNEKGEPIGGGTVDFLTFIQQAPLEGGDGLEIGEQSASNDNVLSSGCAASVTATSLHTMLFVVLICVTAGIRIKNKKSVE